MNLIWTKSSSLLSKFIRWGFKQDCSHFAIVFNSPAGGLLFEANLIGTHPKFLKTALAHGMEVVHQIKLPLTVEEEDAVWDEVVDRLDSKEYDYKAFLFFVISGVLWKLFGIPMPKKNLWAINHSYLCVEVFHAVKKHTVLKDIDIDISMTTPHELYSLLSSQEGV